MTDAERSRVHAFYRTMSTSQLAYYRGAFLGDLRDAQRGRATKLTADFCERRLEVIDLVLGERGLDPNQVRPS